MRGERHTFMRLSVTHIILLLSRAHSSVALVVPSNNPHLPSRSSSRLHSHRSHLHRLRGGDDDSHKSGKINGGTRRQQYQLAIVGAPINFIAGTMGAIANVIFREIRSLTFHQRLFFVATFALGFYLGRLRPFWKRYTNVNDIPPSLFGNQAPVLRGRAVTVSDGDTIRFLHQPTWFHPAQLRKGEKASSTALPIRLCTIDTPETAKFGNAGQPFGEEAKEYLKGMLDSKIVRVRLLQKDQYGRAVGEVFTSRFPFLVMKKYMDAQMLKAGLAEVYTGGGAVYGPLGKDEYLAIEEKARKSKKGIWSQKNRESAAEYKKRTK